MIFENKLVSSLPVGLENARNPLGHSGHLRLHVVVGSTAMLIGSPLILDFLLRSDCW